MFVVKCANVDILNITVQSRCIPRLVDGIFKAVCFAIYTSLYLLHSAYGTVHTVYNANTLEKRTYN